ncbi:CAP-Gly domain protein [Mesorhizobium retamae]|uniref:CAP-Gly domain protein n=1 Tax=Mesorhizobium retamae TaxID=2912854 RepID=A0ABS9QHW7_9HYPH|nr:CAP-Gly domain protein [Mesorhizobium sp. IRAMC:0171]MCG7507034.1 CAP-Gly domain protein [Mesorhizobium sp. IRAMC:0171]
MNHFYVGQPVVCVDASRPHNIANWELVQDAVYTIRWLGMFSHYIDGDYLGVKLVEIDRGEDPEFGYHDMPFYARRFRPVVKDPLAVFRNALSYTKGNPPYMPDAPEEPRRRVKVREEEVCE